MALTYECILKKVGFSKKRDILTENIIATHRSLVKNCTAVEFPIVRTDYKNVVDTIHTAVQKYGFELDKMLESGEYQA